MYQQNMLESKFQNSYLLHQCAPKVLDMVVVESWQLFSSTFYLEGSPNNTSPCDNSNLQHRNREQSDYLLLKNVQS